MKHCWKRPKIIDPKAFNKVTRMWVCLNRLWSQSLDESLIFESFTWKCNRVKLDSSTTDGDTRQLIVTPLKNQYLQPLIIAQDISLLPWTPNLWTCSTSTADLQLLDHAILYLLLLFDFYSDEFELKIERGSARNFILFKDWTSRIFNDLSRTRNGRLSKSKQQEFDELIAWYLEKFTQTDKAA